MSQGVCPRLRREFVQFCCTAPALIRRRIEAMRAGMGEDRFWDNLAERYARQPIADEAAYQTKLDITRSYLHPDMAVLEFGCGTGSTALQHAPHVRHIR